MSDQQSRELISAIAERELNWIADQSQSSDKRMVKGYAVKWILFWFKKKKIEFEPGFDQEKQKRFIELVKKTNIYRFASIVETAETKEEFIRLILDEWKDDGSTQSIMLTRTWNKIRNMFQISWKLNFPVPKDLAEESLLRRHPKQDRKEKGEKRTAPEPLAPPQHWTELIPPEYREVVQIASNLPKENNHIFKMLEKETTAFQRTFIKTILQNPFNGDMVSDWAIKVQAGSQSNWYELRIRNITYEVLRMAGAIK